MRYSARVSGIPAEGASKPAQVNVLMLSGGGGWGAFGAGYLKALHDKNPTLVFDTVTGVSTGALQALLVGADDYPALEAQYKIDKESDLAIRGAELDVVKTGYLYDTTPLRQRIEKLLCAAPGDCPYLRRIALNARTQVFIGLVEAGSGDFKVVDVSAMLRHVYLDNGAPVAHPKTEDVRKVAQCVTGVAMASSAIPVFLRTVRIGGPQPASYKTYVDGGVRLSLFEARVSLAAEEAQRNGDVNVAIYAIRNGPTVVKPDRPPENSTVRPIDAKPDAGAVALRSYSTIVNQSEVMSIASLRLLHPSGPINLATADGYYGMARQKCQKMTKDDVMFDKDFMRCLIVWGEDKANRYPWISLSVATDVAGSIPPPPAANNM